MRPLFPADSSSFLEEAEQAEPTFLGTDKAATPAERSFTEVDVTKELDRARPLLLLAQRDSDAQKEVEKSRIGALAKLSTLSLRTGSSLLDQLSDTVHPTGVQSYL